MILFRWLAGFVRFWYDFIVGDDWTAAATVAATLVATWLLHLTGHDAWWLLPVAVVTQTGLSLRGDGH